MYGFDSNKINFEDDNIKVYKGRKIVWQGQFDEYFEIGDEFYDNFEWDATKKVYVGFGPAKGWKVRKVK